VLDLGCSRGEFLGLLRESGVSARGVDVNHEMVEACRSRALRAEERGGLLRALPTGDRL
jgi:O-antigen chain-terminating methyltransferase